MLLNKTWLVYALGIVATSCGFYVPISYADVLCVPKIAQVSKKGKVALGTRMTVRTACAKNEVAVLDTGSFKGSPGVGGIAGGSGPKGDKGDTGPSGATGAKGDKGEKGDKGDTGPQGPGVSWVAVNSATQMEPNIGYIVTGGGEVDLTLPTDPAVGDLVQIREGREPTSWRILPGSAGQTIEGYEGMHSAGVRQWSSLAVSDDGQRLVATVYQGYVHTSTDAGATWSERVSSGRKAWQYVTISGDGTRLIAGGYDEELGYGPGYLYTSSNGGESWIKQTGAGKGSGWQIASSADGLRLVVGSFEDGDNNNYKFGSFIYTSQDGGETWVKREAAGRGSWRSLTSSSDGMNLAALYDETGGCQNLTLLTSSDGGETWIKRSAPEGLGWNCYGTLASSSDGLKLVALTQISPDSPGFIVTSTDGGETWTKRSGAGERIWQQVASSADGVTLYASEGRVVYKSIDGGATWKGVFRPFWPSGLRTNASGSDFYLITTQYNGSNLLFSSAASSSFNEIKGNGQQKLIYLGEGAFGIVQ